MFLHNFFTNIDTILIQFLTPLILSWQRFQISQSFTYKGCLVLSSVEVSCFDTVNDAFIKDVDDEPQTTLKSLLNGVEFSNIIELWRIRRIGGLSYHENIVALLSDRTHLCTCMETITKGIICYHFWCVMLYSIHAKFHISIIPTRWYKDSIVDQLDVNLKNSPVLFQKLEYNEIIRRTTPLKNRFGVAFSISKTAINIALETNSDEELIQMLKNFIAIKRQVVPLQQQFINQITDLNVVKICGAPFKKKLKSFTEVLGRRANDQKTSNVKFELSTLKDTTNIWNNSSTEYSGENNEISQKLPTNIIEPEPIPDMLIQVEQTIECKTVQDFVKDKNQDTIPL
ncbi:28796_t:CDS:2 [Gigaspora margarita]|uniref:28796_t:CDS:1 n=1 Tax=Gigaspora margarita TaxID=4874 RepID=A0ABN7UWB2_GIGMA|nr:28796_t:CDS:2 [Gigaspora margarita]